MNLPANKSLGQHWLDDQYTLNNIVDSAEISAGETVLEVGPGHGTLTKVLLAKGARVIAVELDKELAYKLSGMNSDNLEVINEDILDFNLTSIQKNYKVVANIPYYLTSNLIRVLCESANPPDTITLLVQKEVAQRICAKPGEMSVLSISAQVYYECDLGAIVTADKFSPPPKVDSQVVIMVRRKESVLRGVDKKQFFRVVKAGFSNRRKTLVNSLSAGLHLSKEEIVKILNTLSIFTNIRPQELSINQWVELTRYLTS